MPKKRIGKNFLALGLIFVMLFSALIPGPSSSRAYAAEVWIEISDAAGLNNIRNNLSANYVLLADIDLNGASWAPIGTNATPFTGKLNGNSKVIRNFVINDTNGSEQGLFGAIGAAGEVKYLDIEGANIIAGDNAGILVGVNNGTVERTFAKGNITGKLNVGGLVGSNDTTGQVVNSFASAYVAGKGSVGGLIGENKGGVTGSYSSSQVANSVFNNYLQFDGTDDYISIPHNAAYATEKFTLEAWFQWDDVGTDQVDFIIGKGFEQFEIHTGGGSGVNGIRFIPIPHVGSDSWIDANNVMQPGWFHVAAVYDYDSTGGYADAKIYINGVPQELKQIGSSVGTTARMDRASNPLSANNEAFNIGRRSGGGSNFKGKISDVRFWNVARTAEQIVADKDRQLAGTEPGLIGYWKLNEESGNAQDSTSNNNDGTLLGDITRVQEVPTNFGGLVGNNTGTVSSSYYDSDVSGQTDDADKGVPKTTLEMKNQETFTGWDFTTIWTIDAGVNSGYPLFRPLPVIDLTADTTDNNVDNDIEITFAADADFEAAITGVSFDGSALTETTDYVVESGKVTLKPGGGNVALQTPATDDVVITATGYSNSTVSQTITAGAVASLTVSTQPVPGAGSGDAFATQPVVTLKDQYGNVCTNGLSATANIVATAKAGTGTWTIGGTSTKAAVAGVATFTDLTSSLASPGNGAITFTSGVITADSNTFTIPAIAGKALTADTTDNNVDNDIEITFAADADFEAAITGVSFNGTALTETTDYVVESGKVTLKPNGGNVALQTPATGNVVIAATGYSNSTVSQTITHGALTAMVLSQNITAPATNGGNFAQQPLITLTDAYGNTVSSDNTTQVTVNKKDAGNWTLKGTVTVTAVNGVVTFTGLGADNSAQVTNAQLAFNSGVLAEVTSTTVILPGSTSAGSSEDSSSGSEGTNTSATNVDVLVLVNGQVQNAGSATTTIQGGSTITTIVVDEKKLEEKLSTEGDGAVVTIPVNTKADVIIGELNGQMVKKMETKQAVVEVKNEKATYSLPAQQINIDAVSAQLGTNIELKDIKVQIEIANPTPDEVKVVEDSAKKGEFSIVVPPVEFNVKCTYGNRTVDVNRFNSYVERRIAVPEGVDPKKITTGVVVGPDGSVRHVPTQIIIIDGKYFAQINSLTNSMYSLVWNLVEFKDVQGHWAQEAINDMGARMVTSGVGDNVFLADRSITRAEFATILVRALGLKPETEKTLFTDVKVSDWYSGNVETAYEYGILSGTGDGKFRPMDKITREQAMVMIARAMELTGLKVSLRVDEVEKLLAGYSDSGQSSLWAKNSIAALVKVGLVSGKNDKTLAPKDEITRAEAVVIVRNLLQKSKLI